MRGQQWMEMGAHVTCRKDLAPMPSYTSERELAALASGGPDRCPEPVVRTAFLRLAGGRRNLGVLV